MDAILTMPGYFDGPRSGICTFGNIPMFYESTWEDLDAGDGPGVDRFFLARVDEVCLKAATEAWKIWEKWGAALHSPQIKEALELSENRERMYELDALVKEHWEAANWDHYVERSDPLQAMPVSEEGMFAVNWVLLPFPSALRFRELWRGRYH